MQTWHHVLRKPQSHLNEIKHLHERSPFYCSSRVSHNVARAADGTGHVVAVLGEVAGAATETRSSAEVVRDASQSAESTVANLRLEVEDFLAKVAV